MATQLKSVGWCYVNSIEQNALNEIPQYSNVYRFEKIVSKIMNFSVSKQKLK